MKKLPKKRWAFREWFEGQFGKRPTNKSYSQLREDVENAERHAIALRTLMNRLHQYDDLERAAMYAWNLRDGDKSR